MIKSFLIVILFLQTYLVANIDINKKAITIGLSSSLSKAKQIAKYLSSYDIYIYKTTTTKRPYFIMYAVNIKKENQQKVLNMIHMKYKDAYISSDSRVKKLATNNFKENTFIFKSKFKTNDLFNIKKFYTQNTTNERISIGINKKSIFVTYVDNKKELLSFIKKYKKFDIYVENIKNQNLYHYKRCCALYIVNIRNLNFTKVFEKLKLNYKELKEERSIVLKYNMENNKYNILIEKSYKETQ